MSFTFLLLASLLWVAAPHIAGEPADCAKVIKIAISGTDSPACLQGNGSCRTLRYAFTNCTITNSTQFLIGPGTFSLTQDLGTIYSTPFSWLQGLVVKGSGAEETIVDCSSESGLAFVNMTNLTISDLTLFNCSQSRPSTSIGNVSEPHTIPFEVGLYIWRCRHVVIENVHINETIGVGLVLYETGGRVSINSSVFHHNGIPENMTDTLYGGGGVNIEFPYCPPGHYDDDECGKELSGAEYSISNCYFTNNTALLGMKYSEQFITPERSIHQSFGRGGGMAIYFSGNTSDNNVSLSDCHFVGNRAVFGGGLLGEFNDQAQHNGLNLVNCSFAENACFHSTQVNGGGGGGARLGFLLYKANSVANNEIHIETTLFSQNKAYLGGGVSFVTGNEQGVLAPTNRFVMLTSVFKLNVARLGSAVNLMLIKSQFTGLVAEVQIQDSIFEYNSVLYSNDSWYLMGFGTVYSYKVPFDITGVTYFHTNNGSGIVVVGTGVNVRSSATIGFLHNVATNGGAIAAYASGWIMLWNDTELFFSANKAQSRGGAIYSESTGGSQIIEPGDCVIRYFEWWRHYEAWDSQLRFEGNLADEAGNEIFISSLFPCIRSGSNGSADISLEARKNVFRATPPFYYFGKLTNNSIKTGAAEIKFKVNMSRDDLHITIYPGQIFNLTTKIRPLDELGAHSHVPFFATTHVSNNTFPAAVVNPSSEYTTGYIQFEASSKVNQGNGSANTIVQLQTVSEPALLFSFNVSLSECPPGSNVSLPNHATAGQCECARNFTSDGYLKGIMCYEHGSNLSIFRHAFFWYGKVPSKSHSRNISVTAPCPIYCQRTNSDSNLVPLDQTDPTLGVCIDGARGILCGTCDNGIIITSHTFECCILEVNQTTSVPGAWVAWISSQLFLTTVIILSVLLLGFDVVGGTLCSYVFFSQIVLDLNLHTCTSGTTLKVIENIERLYAFWSLRFRYLLPNVSLCLPSICNALYALALDYVFAFSPFILIIIVWIITYGQRKGWCCCQCICKTVDSCLKCFKNVKYCDNFLTWFSGRLSLAHGIATCLILTYGDLLTISFFILAPAQLNVPSGTDLDDIEEGPWRSLYNGDFAYFGYPHCIFGTFAIIVVMVFGFLPPLFLMSYPWLPRLLRMCNIKLGDKVEGWYQKRVVHHFLDLFQGHFKDNHRYFAGMWLVYRLILQAIDAFFLDCTTCFTFQISFSVGFLLLHSILQPNRKTKYNILDSLFLANIILLSTLGLVFWSSNGQGSDTNAITAAMAIFLILPHLYFFAVVVYRIANWIYGRRCCRGQDAGEQQSLLNVATAAMTSFVVRRKADSSDHEDSTDDGVSETEILFSTHVPKVYGAVSERREEH